MCCLKQPASSVSTASADDEIPFVEFAIAKTIEGINKFISFTGFRNATRGNLIMIVVGLFFIYLAIRYDYEPLLLVPIGTGIIIGNHTFFSGWRNQFAIGYLPGRKRA